MEWEYRDALNFRPMVSHPGFHYSQDAHTSPEVAVQSPFHLQGALLVAQYHHGLLAHGTHGVGMYGLEYHPRADKPEVRNYVLQQDDAPGNL